VAAEQTTKERLAALEDIVFSDDANIAEALLGMLSLVQHLAFIMGDTFHDLSVTFAGGMEHISKLLDQSTENYSDNDPESEDGPHLVVVPDGDGA